MASLSFVLLFYVVWVLCYCSLLLLLLLILAIFCHCFICYVLLLLLLIFAVFCCCFTCRYLLFIIIVFCHCFICWLFALFRRFCCCFIFAANFFCFLPLLFYSPGWWCFVVLLLKCLLFPVCKHICWGWRMKSLNCYSWSQALLEKELLLDLIWWRGFFFSGFYMSVCISSIT